jgi:predicted secreted protein
MKNIPIMTCALSFIILVATLAGAEVTVLQMQDSGKEIRVKAGEVIELALKIQAGTGYTWEFHHLDEKHFRVVHTETKSLAEPNVMGGPVLQIWRLKAIEPGDATLSLDYFRPWEGRDKAVKHFEVKVFIH